MFCVEGSVCFLQKQRQVREKEEAIRRQKEEVLLIPAQSKFCVKSMLSHQPHSPDTRATAHHIHSLRGACCFHILHHVLQPSCSAPYIVC